MSLPDYRMAFSLRDSLSKYGRDFHRRPLFVKLLLPTFFVLASLTIFLSYSRHSHTNFQPAFDAFSGPHVEPDQFDPEPPSSPQDAPLPPPPAPNREPPCRFSTSAATLREDLKVKEYSRAVIRPSLVHTQQPSLTYVNGSILSPFQPLEPGFRAGALPSENDCSNIPIAEVEAEYDPSESFTKGLLLGMTTPLKRLDMRLDEISYYLLTSRASLLVVVPGDVDTAKEQKRYRDWGLDITLVASKVEPFQLRYFSMIRELNLHISSSRPETEWVATVDDDTFFPQLAHLGARLATLDPTEYHWVGTISESSLNVKNFGYFSYGGSGVFLSRPLLERLDASYDQCTGPDLGQPSFGGDHRITKCIRRLVPDVELEVWKELRQWDLRGRPAGMFESGKPIWTFHHWGETGWFDKDVLSMCGTANIAGQSSILRRFMLNRTGGYNESEARSYYILTNGFSIVKYDLEPGVPDINFDETEYTWADNPVDYEEFVGPFRQEHVEGITKKRWLLDSVIRSGNNIHQKYKYEGERKGGGENNIIEIIWLGPGS